MTRAHAPVVSPWDSASCLPTSNPSFTQPPMCSLHDHLGHHFLTQNPQLARLGGSSTSESPGGLVSTHAGTHLEFLPPALSAEFLTRQVSLKLLHLLSLTLMPPSPSSSSLTHLECLSRCIPLKTHQKSPQKTHKKPPQHPSCWYHYPLNIKTDVETGAQRGSDACPSHTASERWSQGSVLAAGLQSPGT